MEARTIEIIQEFQNLPYDILILKYDVAFAEFCEHVIQDELYDKEKVDYEEKTYYEYEGGKEVTVKEPVLPYKELEIEFIKILDRYRIRRNIVVWEYKCHCDSIGKPFPDSVNEFEELAERPNYLFHFFQNKLIGLDSSIKLQKDITSIKEGDPVDLSDSKPAEIINYLYELGILNLLRSQLPLKNDGKLNVNALAKLVSAFTGLKVTTAQSYLNPIFSEKIDQRNNPLNSTKARERVQKHLANLGVSKKKMD